MAIPLQPRLHCWDCTALPLPCVCCGTVSFTEVLSCVVCRRCLKQTEESNWKSSSSFNLAHIEIFLSADPSCSWNIPPTAGEAWCAVSAPCLSSPPITSASHCLYCGSEQKWGVFYLFLNHQDAEEIMGERVVCQKQFRSTSQCLLPKERSLCWAYSWVHFQDDSGDNCSNWTKQFLPHISSSQAAESPAGTNWKEPHWLVGVTEQGHLQLSLCSKPELMWLGPEVKSAVWHKGSK